MWLLVYCFLDETQQRYMNVYIDTEGMIYLPGVWRQNKMPYVNLKRPDGLQVCAAFNCSRLCHETRMFCDVHDRMLSQDMRQLINTLFPKGEKIPDKLSGSQAIAHAKAICHLAVTEGVLTSEERDDIVAKAYRDYTV